MALRTKSKEKAPSEREFAKYDEIKYPIQARRSEHCGIGLHWHTYFEVELIIAGEPTHIINGRLIKSRPGDISVMTPIDFHGFTGENFEVKKFIFDAESLPSRLSALLMDEKNPRMIRLGQDQRLYGEFSSMLDEIIESTSDRSLLGLLRTQNLAEQVLIKLLTHTELRLDGDRHGQSDGLTEERLGIALRCILERFNERLTLETVAAELHVSPSYFSRYFSRTLGTCFSRYLKLKRIRYASALLLSSKLSVEEIAYRSGFSSLTFFNRAFREQCRMSPHEYRERFLWD